MPHLDNRKRCTPGTTFGENMFRLCLPDGTYRDYPTKAQLYAAIREMNEAYDGYLK